MQITAAIVVVVSILTGKVCAAPIGIADVSATSSITVASSTAEISAVESSESASEAILVSEDAIISLYQLTGDILPVVFDNTVYFVQTNTTSSK